jgi:hypothetical protein
MENDWKVFFFVFSKAFSPDIGTTQPLIQWVTQAFSLGVRWLGCEAHHLLLSSAEVNNQCSYISTPPYAFKLSKRHNFTHSLKNTTLSEVLRKIKIGYQSRQLQRTSLDSFSSFKHSLGTSARDGTYPETFVFLLSTLEEICNKRLIHYCGCSFANF